MALLFTTPSSSLFSSSQNPTNTKQTLSLTHLSPSSSSLSLPFLTRPTTPLALRLRRLRASPSDSDSDDPSDAGPADEWGEPPVPEPASAYSKLSAADPPKNDDEWGPDGYPAKPAAAAEAEASSDESEEEEKRKKERVSELKRCLADTVYGTELGFRARLEERAEILELVNQLEALNPTPAPTQSPELLAGDWVLLYTGFSELLPLLAAGSTPLLKVNKISQSIDISSSTIVNATSLSSPFSTFSFSATATFEVRSPSRIQVQFKEGTFQPPEIKSSVDLPGEVDVFGQKINLSPLQQTLNPIQEAVANISRVISGQPPLRLPIPGERTSSWLLITYLDEDFRISRGDGGLFVLAKEGSPLLYQ